MSMICAISGESTNQPMVSKKSGIVFDKQAILKHLSSFPYCPITNETLGADDLVEVNTTAIQNLSIAKTKPEHSPLNYLTNLKTEYDALVLELFYLKKALRENQTQLAHSLTANQSSQRVIAKLLLEKQTVEKELEKMEMELAEQKKASQ